MSTEKSPERDAQTVTPVRLNDLPPKDARPEESDQVTGGMEPKQVKGGVEPKKVAAELALIIV